MSARERQAARKSTRTLVPDENAMCASYSKSLAKASKFLMLPAAPRMSRITRPGAAAGRFSVYTLQIFFHDASMKTLLLCTLAATLLSFCSGCVAVPPLITVNHEESDSSQRRLDDLERRVQRLEDKADKK
jgi:hypothetical protein